MRSWWWRFLALLVNPLLKIILWKCCHYLYKSVCAGCIGKPLRKKKLQESRQRLENDQMRWLKDQLNYRQSVLEDLKEQVKELKERLCLLEFSHIAHYMFGFHISNIYEVSILTPQAVWRGPTQQVFKYIECMLLPFAWNICVCFAIWGSWLHQQIHHQAAILRASVLVQLHQWIHLFFWVCLSASEAFTRFTLGNLGYNPDSLIPLLFL